jgi:CheY-like chemotaxis protein
MPKSLCRVIVVDDDYISLFLITNLFAQQKIAEIVLPFTNGIEALNYLAKNAGDFSQLPEIILLDIKMPDINGWQFLQRLNAIEFAPNYEPAICIISAGISLDFDILENSPYVKGYLLKPIMQNKLLAIIESLTPKMQESDVIENVSLAMSN